MSSGTKQIKVMAALYDDDRISGRTGGFYLARSAQLLRVALGPAPIGSGGVDRCLVLLLDAGGPRYVRVDEVGTVLSARRVGYTYYTRQFAEVLYREVFCFVFFTSGSADRCSSPKPEKRYRKCTEGGGEVGGGPGKR